MVSSTAQNFSAAMKRIVNGMPYGSQTEIAEKLGVSRQYLNDLLSGRKRRSLHTADYREAMAIYRDLIRKQDFSESQSKTESVESFVSDYLEWSKGLYADNTLKCAREAMAKLQRHIGVLSLNEVGQKAVDRLISGIMSEGIARPSANSNLKKIKSAFKKALEWYGYPDVKIKLLVAPFGSYCTGFFRYASNKIISLLSSAFMVT